MHPSLHPFEEILACLSDAAVVVDTREDVVLANKAAAELVGIARADLPRAIAGYPGIFPRRLEGNGATSDCIAERALRGEGVAPRPQPLQRADGRVLRVRASSAPIRDVEGRIVGALVVFRDAPAPTGPGAREALVAAGGDARDRTPQGHGASDGVMRFALDRRDEAPPSDVERTDRFRELLIGVVSHDLRAPLSAIVMSASSMLHRGGLSEVHERAVTRTLASAQRMGRMIAQLLDFTRSRLGGGIPTDRSADKLSEICARVVEEWRAAHPERAIELRVDDQADGEWDGDRLAQVVSNLVGNAVQHGAGDRPVTVSVDGDADTVAVRVHNEGAPIPASLRASIFDPFRRASSLTPSTGAAGLGLGLYICEQIVSAHGGSLEAISDEGRGTVFVARMPRRPPRYGASAGDGNAAA
jgi:PAS domain S-box-containing protein